MTTERPKLSGGYRWNPETRTWSKVALPIEVASAGRELHYLRFLRWLVKQKRIGGKNDE